MSWRGRTSTDSTSTIKTKQTETTSTAMHISRLVNSPGQVMSPSQSSQKADPVKAALTQECQISADVIPRAPPNSPSIVAISDSKSSTTVSINPDHHELAPTSTTPLPDRPLQQEPPLTHTIITAIPNAPSPLTHSLQSVPTSLSESAQGYHHEFTTYNLYTKLQSICLNAARSYYLHHALSFPDADSHHHHHQYSTNRGIYASPDVVSRAEANDLELSDYLVLLSGSLWERALGRSKAESMEAVRRMNSLWSWGEKVEHAVRRMGVAQPPVFDLDAAGVFSAARDLVGWLLDEEGKCEVERLWMEEYVEG